MKHDVKDQALGKPNGKGEFLEDVKMKQEDVTAVTNQRLMNPLAGIEPERLLASGEAFAEQWGLKEYSSEFRKGALVAGNPEAFESMDALDDEDKMILRREVTHKWDQPRTLYFLVVCCSVAAAVQGMDESVINGANLFFPNQFGIGPLSGGNASENQWYQGLVLGAPYLCCATIGCWLTDPLNRWLGRRGTIFLTAMISALTCIWSGLTSSWPHLFIARFALGFGIGPKSATVPVYAAECAPPLIRGALVMQWQVWTAFGIAIGTVADLVFLNVKDTPSIVGLNWRLMLGSACLPAFFVAGQIYFCPESPRWLISKGRYSDAFTSLCRLRHSKLQAARDLFYIDALIKEEELLHTGKNRFVEMFSIGRNRRAALASGIVMFMQQFCGINVIAYYSSTIFTESGFTTTQAFVASFGFGMLNFIFSAPAIYTIDTYGRRFLLLTTFPLMAIFLLMTGMAFFIQDLTTRIAIVALGIYLHVIAYSPGEGPVPFTYSAEAFPLYIRDIGMSYATAVTWGFNFIVALTFPRLLGAFRPQGAFGFYAAWNVFGFVMILLFVPETKALSLEELDQVFSVPTRTHAAYQLRQVPYWLRKNILRQNVGPQEVLYPWEAVTGGRAEDLREISTEKGAQYT